MYICTRLNSYIMVAIDYRRKHSRRIPLVAAMVLLLAVFLTGCGKHDPATLKIRRGTKVIEAEAYKDNKEIRTVIIPNTVTSPRVSAGTWVTTGPLRDRCLCLS